MSQDKVLKLIEKNDSLVAAGVLADDLSLSYKKASSIVQAYISGDINVIDDAYRGIFKKTAEDGRQKSIEKTPKSIEQLLKKYRNIWLGDIDGFSFAVCPVPEHLSALARHHFKIGFNESILFYYKDEGFWAGQKSFTAITENGIWGQQSEDDQVCYIPWSEVKEVKYQEYNLYFFDYDGDNTYVGIGYFTKNCTPDQGKRLAKVFNECASIVAPPVDPYDAILQLENEEKYDEALQLLDQSLSSGAIEADWMYHFYKGRFLVKKERTQEEHFDKSVNLIEKEFDKAMELSDDGSISPYCYYWLAGLYDSLGQSYNARDYAILAMDANTEEIRDNAKEILIEEEEALKDVWDNYTTTYEYKERKFLMPIKDSQIAGCIVGGIDTFRLSNIPSCIKFPTGHPVANELYIGHPYNPNIYVPYSESEDIFFLDKVDELTYLLQCLGAEEITITSIKGKSVSEYDDRTGRYSAHADTGIIEASGSGGKTTKREQNYDSRQEHSLHIKCDPMKYPYVPEGLVWYGELPRWQRMVEGRLNGNRLEYSESISSTDTRFVSNTEKKDIKAAAERLWIKVDGSAESNLETQFKEHTETQWRVDVKFRSLRDFAAASEPINDDLPLSSSEQESSFVISPELKETLQKNVSNASDAAIAIYNDWIAEKPTSNRLDGFLNRLEKDEAIRYILEYRYFLEALFRFDAISNPGINDLEQYIRAEAAINEALIYEEDGHPQPELHLLKGLIAFEPVYYQNDKNQGLRFTEKNKQTFLECKEYLKQLEEFDGMVFQGKELYQEDYAFCELYFDNPTEFWRRFNEEKGDSHITTLTEDEQEYLEMYKEYASDGELSERDRKMLDKFRIRLGISEERAQELEASCSEPELSEDEQEYLEMYKEYAVDGEISEKDRKMLNKMRDRMGISEERAKEIEAII